MLIRVGLTDNDLIGHLHKSVKVSSAKGLLVSFSEPPIILNGLLKIEASGCDLLLTSIGSAHIHRAKKILIAPQDTAMLVFESIYRASGNGRQHPEYSGSLELSAVKGMVKAVLVTDLEDYLQGVLESEMPASYHLEALKAQAVAARTYALHPRISHAHEGFDVCDSYLCCQYFAGQSKSISARQAEAIHATANQVLMYKEKPVLALFSSCAGGHTENYENCFSDLDSNAFPSAPLTYLTGVPEGKLPSGFPSEASLRALWHQGNPDTDDSWSNHFRWQVKIPASALEGHMHYVVSELKKDPQFSPFIQGPPSSLFGHIKGFEINQRGVSGIAMLLTVKTSTGDWKVEKELTIRNIFKNPDIKLARLKSARMYFDYAFDRLGLISELTISGLGWGHGVGMQQTGAQGLALKGRLYTEILAHYFRGAAIARVN